MIPAEVLQATRTEIARRRLDRDAQLVPVTREETDSGGQRTTEGEPLDIRIGVAPGLGGQQELEQRLLDRIGNRPYYVVVLNAQTTVSEDDIIIQLSPIVKRYQVLSVQNEDISFEVLRRLIVVEDVPE